jgi:hypothetical protein
MKLGDTLRDRRIRDTIHETNNGHELPESNDQPVKHNPHTSTTSDTDGPPERASEREIISSNQFKNKQGIRAWRQHRTKQGGM